MNTITFSTAELNEAQSTASCQFVIDTSLERSSCGWLDLWGDDSSRFTDEEVTQGTMEIVNDHDFNSEAMQPSFQIFDFDDEQEQEQEEQKQDLDEDLYSDELFSQITLPDFQEVFQGSTVVTDDFEEEQKLNESAPLAFFPSLDNIDNIVDVLFKSETLFDMLSCFAKATKDSVVEEQSAGILQESKSGEISRRLKVFQNLSNGISVNIVDEELLIPGCLHE